MVVMMMLDDPLMGQWPLVQGGQCPLDTHIYWVAIISKRMMMVTMRRRMVMTMMLDDPLMGQWPLAQGAPGRCDLQPAFMCINIDTIVREASSLQNAWFFGMCTIMMTNAKIVGWTVNMFVLTHVPQHPSLTCCYVTFWKGPCESCNPMFSSHSISISNIS